MPSKSILLSTLGTSWPLVPELLAFLDPQHYHLFKNHPEFSVFKSEIQQAGIFGIDELWLITTDDEKTTGALMKIEQWLSLIGASTILMRVFRFAGLKDLENFRECHWMTELVFRTVLKAKKETDGGKLILSLAGGRKTMSSDMQRAGDFFGCDLLLHLANRDPLPVLMRDPQPSVLTGILPAEVASSFFPLVVQNFSEPNPILFIPKPIEPEKYPIEPGNPCQPSLELTEEIGRRMRSARHEHFNAYKARSGATGTSSFQALNQLHPQIIMQLQQERIHGKVQDESVARSWISKLPKAELHCHLGGILSVLDICRVAHANRDDIQKYELVHSGYREWLQRIRKLVETDNLNELAVIAKGKGIRTCIAGIPEPLTVAGFAACFRNREDLLDKLIYGDYLIPGKFEGIGIQEYERLGDLQGSGLLQSANSLREACRILKEYTLQQAISYLELRCSPCNYERGGLTARQVVEILHGELADCPHTCFRLIIIGSRHGDMGILQKHINLGIDLAHTNKYQDFVVGFDLAGNESKASPQSLRDVFLPLMKECMHITIHAGEGQPVENIWEATYVLNADRIGHGLTLGDRTLLLDRFIERRIIVEMCPSSNLQIVGFANQARKDSLAVYPLYSYLKRGLKVTVNTDNPGISKTNLTDEYMHAAWLTPGGLSKWEILQLARNAFLGGFVSKEKRKNLMFETEKQLFSLLAE